ncbi:heavy metal translocating P-type ATPase [Helcococcus kunzii]|uniref:heavy metal translocating P-type ATPase n=1 Tax=Helcococcus kunzii TaxID=40091 RepID=UPI0028832CA4|nr:cation-translocating P-type ATPase [Helcococcus kunzii]
MEEEIIKKLILNNKNKITLISGILIIFAFINQWIIKKDFITNVFFIISSVIGSFPIILSAIGALKVKVISIDVLVTIAVIGAFFIKNFEESAIVIFLFLFGSYLEQRTLRHTRSAIKELLDMSPNFALKVNVNGEIEEVTIEDIQINDLILAKTGSKIPVDGKIIAGEGYINESSITGESIPIKKSENSQVFAGTIVENGTFKIRTEKIGEDTIFGKIIELVEESQDLKSETERFIDSFAKYYTPIVLILSFVVLLMTNNIELSITILVLGCPGALVIGVPVSNVAGIGNGAQNGVLFKGSEVIKDFSKVNTVIFDKTGTLTIGKPQISEIKFYANNKEEIINLLVSVEKESDHPLAKAIVQEFENNMSYKTSDTNVVKGGGIISTVDGKQVVVGNIYLMQKENIEINEEQKLIIEKYLSQGNSTVITAIDKKIVSIMGIKDKIRPNVKEVIQKIKNLGVNNLIILSGDNQKIVDLVSKELGMTLAYGELLPEDKSKYVEKMIKKDNIVAFVGDGINDSPSLAIAQVGIAMGNGTDVVIESSDIVMINSDISKLPYALGLSKSISRNMIQNIFIALGTVFILLLGLIFSNIINMSIGMFIHEISILAVIINGMRLLNYKNKGGK